MGRDYAAEVSMSLASKVEYDGEVFEITVEGRADGVISLISEEEKISAGIETQKHADILLLCAFYNPSKIHFLTFAWYCAIK